MILANRSNGIILLYVCFYIDSEDAFPYSVLECKVLSLAARRDVNSFIMGPAPPPVFGKL